MGGSAAASVPQLCHCCQPGFQGSDGAAHAAAGSGHASSWALHAAHLAGMTRNEKTTPFGIDGNEKPGNITYCPNLAGMHVLLSTRAWKRSVCTSRQSEWGVQWQLKGFLFAGNRELPRTLCQDLPLPHCPKVLSLLQRQSAVLTASCCVPCKSMYCTPPLDSPHRVSKSSEGPN